MKQTDTLYVLGDILDRGPHPIQIILKIMEMPNVVCLTGNHELMALECLEFLMQEITKISIEKVDEKMLENLVTWQYNGSKSTIDEFRTLSREMQYEVSAIDNYITICGHRPIGGNRIWKNDKRNLYMIDCDRGFENGRLGCLCLETREEFYV